MAATSQLRAGVGFGEVWVSDWQAAGLLKPSAIKPVFATLEQALVIRRLGALTRADQESVRSSIKSLLG